MPRSVHTTAWCDTPDGPWTGTSWLPLRVAPRPDAATRWRQGCQPCRTSGADCWGRAVQSSRQAVSRASRLSSQAEGSVLGLNSGRQGDGDEDKLSQHPAVFAPLAGRNAAVSDNAGAPEFIPTYGCDPLPPARGSCDARRNVTRRLTAHVCRCRMLQRSLAHCGLSIS